MSWNKSLLIVAALLLLMLSGNAFAQGSGTAYQISVGSPNGGGGISATSAYSMTGIVPLTGSGVLTSPGFSAIGGTTGIIYGSMTSLIAEYDGSSTETVTKTNRLVKVGYSGSVGTASGVFRYRYGGQDSYQSANMTAGTGDTLVYTVPSTVLTIRGLEYYCEITRGTATAMVGSPTSPNTFRVSLTNAQAQVPSNTPANQYRMIGVPLSITGGNTVASVFEDDLGVYNNSQWRIGRYDATAGTVQEYSDAAAVVPGRGYWLITATAEAYGAAGVSVVPNRLNIDGVDYYDVQLDNGWNQLANPFAFSIVWSDVRFVVDGVLETGHQAATLEDFAYSWNGSGYTTLTIIPAWSAVFVHILKDNVSALIPYDETIDVTKSVPKENKEMFSSFNWYMELVLEAGDYIDAENYFGVKPDALAGLDQYDYSEPPPAPGAPNLGFKIADDEIMRRTDYRSPITDGASWNIEISKVPDRLLRIVGIENKPVEYETWLVTDDGKKYNISKDSEIVLPNDVSSAKLFIGSNEYAQDEMSSIVPDDFSLEQNYPNPFNPKTTIRFALPENNKTTLEIYNVLGQKVKTVVDEELPAGYHIVIWDGKDNQGKEAASGVYFYRLTSGENSAYRKMLLVK